ncbi:Ribosomal silencing factor RsfS [Choanephora cucurbitarum]|uniref:Ribosomal silencing factor RsfS n=1 Tax=Choanephora cucurbitarum TaxID=101091 RepID=A0A1C7NA37_9FUNG|nr:Ribosomal silencing factor RsfS [Choanephora cucurbitarum]
MLRFTRLTTRHFKSCIKPPRVYIPSMVHSVWRHQLSTSSFVYSTQKEIEDVEQIDPKDYPELYPENDEAVEFNESDETVDTDWFVDPDYSDERVLSETDFIPMWQRQALGEHLEDRLALQQASKELMESGKLTAQSVSALLEESKMERVEVIDVREKCDWAEYMIVASSSKGDKYLNSVAEQIGSMVKKAIQSSDKIQSAPYVEGKNDKSGWILVDLGRIVIHLFTPEMREHYDIEGLWNSVSTDPTQPIKED